MLKKIYRWLTGVAPQTLGVYWGTQGACISLKKADGRWAYVFQPPAPDGLRATLLLALQRMEAHTGIPCRSFGFAVAIDADDVFVRSLRVPAGLSERQLEQASIVEAVSSLPVPPEEICLDFLRQSHEEDHKEAEVSVAFCRRDVIDQILAESEGLQADIIAVDRDAQAIHDAAVAYLDHIHVPETSIYPIAIVLLEISPRVVVCLAEATLEIYPLRLTSGDMAGSAQADLTQQLASCWTRCRMSYGAQTQPLQHILVIGAADTQAVNQVHQLGLDGAPDVLTLAPRLSGRWDAAGDFIPTDEVLLISAGMATRPGKYPRFNLMPHRAMSEDFARRVLARQVAVVAVVALILASVGAVLLQWQVDAATAARQLIVNALSELAPSSRESRELEQVYASMLRRQQLIESLDARRSTSVLLLSDIAESLPSQMYLVRVEENGETLVLEGRADKPATVGNFLQRLVESEYLFGLNLEEIRLQDEATQAPYQFRVTGSVRLVGTPLPVVSSGERSQ